MEVLSLTVWVWRRRKAVRGKGWLTESMNELLNHEAIYTYRAPSGFARVLPVNSLSYW